jgi:hypothetical protein
VPHRHCLRRAGAADARELAYRTPEASRVPADVFDPMSHAVTDALHRAGPGSTRAQAAWAYQFALGALIHPISDHRVRTRSHGRDVPNDACAGALLIDFVSAGFAAALSPEASTTPPVAAPGDDHK